MNPSSVLRANRPLSAKEIAETASAFHFNTNIPFKHWTRAAETLWQEAAFALRDGDIRKAYMMLFRFTNLVLTMHTHPEYRSADAKKLFKPLSDKASRAIALMEQVKPEINREYDEWRRMAGSPKPEADVPRRTTYEHFAARDPSLSGNAKVLDAAENQELAIDLARKEFRRRDEQRRATRRAGVSEAEERERRKAGSWDVWDQWAASGARVGAEEDDIQRQMQAVRRRLDQPSPQQEDQQDHAWTHGGLDGQGRHDAVAVPPPTTYNFSYPAIAKSRPVRYESVPATVRKEAPPPQPPKPPKERDLPPLQPPKPLKERELSPIVPRRESVSKDLPPLWTPSASSIYSAPSPSARGPSLPPKEVPSPPTSTESHLEPPLPPKKQQRLTFRPAAYLENGDPVRPIFLPSQLRAAFLDIAADSTRRGLEMCGILCGTPVNNALFITHLLIPEQVSTPDTCETVNESALFDYCITEDLLVVGWIHTHPTQTCFMSSRDLHTQAGYQVMMAESIAIVCAPKFEPSYGIFRLTNPPGLTHILQCTQSDTFHQHAIDNIYTGAEHPPGHVYESSKLEFQVHDLRPRRK